MRNEARLVTFIARAIEEIAEDGTQWIEVMPTATEARNGKWFFTITADDLAVYAAHIAANPGTIPVDYDHAETGVGTKAAGWFTGEAEVRGTGDDARLWAQVRWTSSAAEAIRDGEWKRISPEFTFESRDPRTGLMTKAKELIAATLTNRPYFDELSPVAASDLLDTEQLDGLAARYGDDLGRLIALAALLPADDELALLAREILNDEGEIMSDNLKAIAAEAGLADDATEEQILEAVQALKVKAETPPDDGNDDDGESVRLDRETVAKLTASAAKGEEAAKKLHDLERDTLLAKAVSEGKILPVQKDAFATMFDVDASNVKALLEATPARSFSAKGHGEAGGEGEDGDLDAVRSRFTYESSAGRFEADDESLKLHVAAEKILAEDGKKPGHYSEAEYREALLQVRGAEA